jgi:hypothetical protein
MKKIRFSSILVSVAVVLIIFIIALNFYKEEPIYSYTLIPKEPYGISDDNPKSEDIIPDPEQPKTETDNNIIENNIIEEPAPPEAVPEELYYYTKSGTKWHLSKDCRYLKNSKEILEGDLNKTEESGLTPCSACTASYINKEQDKETEKDNREIKIYYYTESGTKWHIDKECRYLKRSKNILEGDYKTVEGKGLSPCSGCVK